MDIKDRVAVVTGGASGLGEACVRRFIADGARASIFDLAEESGRRIAAEFGDSVIFHVTDITDGQSVRSAVAETVAAFGQIHVAVNCAGIGPSAKVLGKDGPMPLNHFEQVVRVNLVGTLNVVRLVAEVMIDNPPAGDGEKGVIINTASAAAFEGQIGQAAYSASKAGVVGMTLPLAREFAGYGIRVMTIAPGLFETPMLAGLPRKVQSALANMVPFPQRMGRPEEFARLVRHIVENSMLNGETIRIDGAIRMAAR